MQHPSPRTSHLTPHTSHFTLHTSHFTRHTFYLVQVFDSNNDGRITKNELIAAARRSKEAAASLKEVKRVNGVREL